MKLLDYDQNRYHADDVGLEVPTLNSGIAKMLVDPSLTPLHAYMAHPKLGGAKSDDGEDSDGEEAGAGNAVFDMGHAIHRAILGRGADFVMCDFKDWRTKAAQAARADIRADGKIPLLRKAYEKIVPIASSAKLAMQEAWLPPIEEFETEVVYIGQTKHGDPTRCMVDAWHPQKRIRIDVKSAADLGARAIDKVMYEGGYAFQDEFYQRVMDCNGDNAEVRLILFVEKSAPYCARLVEADEFGRSIVGRVVDRAESAWNGLLRDGFSGWPRNTYKSTPPDWWVKEYAGDWM